MPANSSACILLRTQRVLNANDRRLVSLVTVVHVCVSKGRQHVLEFPLSKRILQFLYLIFISHVSAARLSSCMSCREKCYAFPKHVFRYI